ncbi:MAG: WYL domain-containing protein [Bacteroidales bacterium]|nr:WYL domain-containing protein [Bacteroidales bacterium]
MPANKNAETRYQILDRLLANRYYHYSTKDLLERINEELDELSIEPICLRSIQGDISYLENGPFQADIEHYQIDVPSQKNPRKTVKKNCLRYRDRSFSIYQQKLTDDEKYLLGEAFTLLGQFDGLPNLEGLDRLKVSLKVKSKRQIVSFTKNPLEGNSLFGELFTAISQKQVIEVHFHKFDSPKEDRTVIVHPYLLKEYNRRWYLIAGADDSGNLLTLALDRMDGFEPLPDYRYIDYDGNLGERFEDIVGVTLYENRPVQTIVFWVSDRSCEYVATKPIQESQTPIRGEREAALRDKFPMLEGGLFFYIECIENYELLRELTSFGADLIVLSPEDIKMKVIDKIKGMCKKYDLLGK